MATEMIGTHVIEADVTRRPYFSSIRWGAVFAGLVSGLASYMLLTLLGVAIGMSAVDPQAAEPVGAVPAATGIWTGISLLISSFIGAYVAGQMSGLARLADGMLHGFVSWGATTLLFATLTVTALGSILGGTFQILSQGLQTSTTAAASGSGNVMDRVTSIITGGERGGDMSPESLGAVKERLAVGDREGAIDIMVNNMGFTPDRAQTVVDQIGPLLGPQGEEQAAETGAKAADALSAASWWMFIGLLLSLALGVWGGGVGVRANARRVIGDHTSERRAHYIEP